MFDRKRYPPSTAIKIHAKRGKRGSKNQNRNSKMMTPRRGKSHHCFKVCHKAFPSAPTNVPKDCMNVSP